MFLDSNLTFTSASLNGAQAVTSTTVQSTGILDMASGLIINTSTATTYPAAGLTLGNATYFAQSLGDGTNPIDVIASVGTAFAGGTSLQVIVQGAVDASSGTYPANISGLTWVTLEAGPVIPLANLTASAMIPGPTIGASPPNLLNYRFVRLAYVPVGTFSGGTVGFSAMGRFPSNIKQMASSAGGFYVGG